MIQSTNWKLKLLSKTNYWILDMIQMYKKFVKLDRELKISYSTQIHRKSCEIFNFILFVFTKKIVKRENSSSVNKFLVKIRQTTLTFFFIHFHFTEKLSKWDKTSSFFLNPFKKKSSNHFFIFDSTEKLSNWLTFATFN